MALFGGNKSKAKSGGRSGGGRGQHVTYGAGLYKGKPQTNVYYGDKGSKSHGHIAISESGKTIYHRGPKK